MKSKTILVALFCIGLSVPISTFAQRGQGSSTGGGGIVGAYSLPVSPIFISVTDNKQLEVFFMSANTTYEMTVTNQSGYIIYKRYVNTQFTQQIKANFKGLPTNSYTVTFKNIATKEVITNNFELR